MKTVLKAILVISVVFTSYSCQQKENQSGKNWIWVHGNNKLSDHNWTTKFKNYKESGIDAVLVAADTNLLKKIIPLAHNEKLEIHVWMWTLNRNGDSIALQHPEWYSVNRLGQSCYDHRPYVEYYQWVCPSIPEVQEHILKQVKGYLKLKDLDGVHLDYVRYSDAILPKGLWSNYGIVQDKVYPEWDYGYNQSNIDIFKAKYSYSPLDIEDPNSDENWVNFRLNTVTELVNKIAQEVHKSGKILSAAVFPSPQMASEMVYQSWANWDLDAAMPMIYHNFYEQNTEWIGSTTKDAVNQVGGKFDIYTGLFLPDIKNTELNKTKDLSMKMGAKGVALFDDNSFDNSFAGTKLNQ